MSNSNMIFKGLIVSLLAFTLVGCGATKVKQGVSDSDAKYLIQMSTKDVILEKNLRDGTTPEQAHTGVEESILQKYNSSTGRHIVNFLAGGISGLVTFGLIQSADSSKSERTYYLLNEPRLITIQPRYFEKQKVPFGEKYNAVHTAKDRVFKRDSPFWIADGGPCKQELRNCYISKIKFTVGANYTYDDFPESFKPDFESEEYQVSSTRLAEFGPNKEGIILRVDSIQTLKNFANFDLSVPRLQTFVYLPASYNNGIPVIIDGHGNEFYFTTKEK